MSGIGNQSYTGVVNAAAQFSNLNTSNLTAINSTVSTETIAGDLIVDNDIIVGGGVDINGTLPVGGFGLDVLNNVSIGGTLGVVGTITGDGFRTTGQAVPAAGRINCAELTTNGPGLALDVSNNANISGTLVVGSTLTVGASWQDGNIGNADFLYFTPTDLLQQAAVSRQSGVSSSNPLAGRPWVVETNGQVVDIVGIKLIPKGFRVKAWALLDPPADGPAIFSADAGGPGVGSVARLDIYSQSMTGQDLQTTLGTTITPAWSLGVTTWNNGTLGTTALSAGTVSDGTLNCVFSIDMNVAMSTTNGITGARIPIERGP